MSDGVRTPSLTLRPRTIKDRGWVEVHPDFAARLAASGLTTPADLLDLPGEVVSGHPDRHVRRVVMPGWPHALYLKRQHRVTWRERARQWRAGFGWRSRCGREATILKQLATAGLPTPRWVAHGEDGAGRAFLLVEELGGFVELRHLLSDTAMSPRDRVRLAARVGRGLAAFDVAGFRNPDLSAKHVFVNPASGDVTLIDWQSAYVGGRIPFTQLFPMLGALHASLADDLAAPRERLRFLGAYRRTAALTMNSVSVYAGAVTAYGTDALKRRSVRDQRQSVVTAAAQRLVWVAGEAVCAVPDVAAAWPTPATGAPFYGCEPGTVRVALPDGRPAELVRGRTVAPWGRFVAWLRGRPWRSPGATLGRVLFHLERYGVPVPRLYAFGQRETGPATAEWFALYEPPADGECDECPDLLARLRDAGCEAVGPVCRCDAAGRVSVGVVQNVRIAGRRGGR